MATINLGAIKFNWKGAYNNSTAYAVDDVVSSGGSSYVCILASQGNAVTNGTYWNVMSQAGTNGTDVGTTLTTQGDILYRDGSGLQRLAKGTAGYVLKQGANDPEWGEASGGGMQLVSAISITGDINTISTDAFSSSYNNYKVFVYGMKINGNTNNQLMFRVRNSSGDYTASTYKVAANGQYGNSGGTSFHNAGQWNVSALDLNGWYLPDDDNWSGYATRDFIFHFWNTNSTTRYKNFWFDYGGADESSNKIHTAHGRGFIENNVALTGFKIYSSAGTNFENEGKVLIYGIKES